jgi:BlaI family transcriptional regulator, penicillinase repressor
MKQKTVISTDSPEPTKSELEILQVLWKFGASTVRFVNDKINEQKEVQYTSTLKLMQIMHEKGILTRDDSAMKHVYNVAIKEESTKSQLLEKFVDSIYQGSASGLMMQLLGNRNASQEELNAIRQLVEEIEKKQTL